MPNIEKMTSDRKGCHIKSNKPTAIWFTVRGKKWPWIKEESCRIFTWRLRYGQWPPAGGFHSVEASCLAAGKWSPSSQPRSGCTEHLRPSPKAITDETFCCFAFIQIHVQLLKHFSSIYSINTCRIIHHTRRIGNEKTYQHISVLGRQLQIICSNCQRLFLFPIEPGLQELMDSGIRIHGELTLPGMK